MVTEDNKSSLDAICGEFIDQMNLTGSGTLNRIQRKGYYLRNKF